MMMNNKKKISKDVIQTVIFTVLIIISFAVQCTVLPFLNVPFPVFLLLPLTVGIAMFKKEFFGFFFGLLAGALWDLAASLTDGTLALFLSAYACAVGLLSKYILRNTLLNTLILTFSACFIYSTISLVLIPGSLSYEVCKQLISTVYLPGSISAVILAVPIYFIVRATTLKFKDETI